MKLPAAFIDSLQNIKGFHQQAFENVHSSGEQVTSIRLNPDKIAAASFLVQNDFDDIALARVPWSTAGYYLSARPSFTSDPLFHAGAYYVQEASSMFLEEVLKQSADLTQSLKILDLCAAPGGKSTLIHSLIGANSLLVSNEVIKGRVAVLSENITKWGASNVIITNNDPKDFQRLPAYFDVIVVDAPCSGSGLFRRDPEVINGWSEQQVELCSLRQQRILTDILPALKEGGVLIYSTCSFSKAEDEEIAGWLIKNYQLSPVHCELKAEWNITEATVVESNACGFRFYPDQLKGEGFFIAAFRNEKPQAERRQPARTKLEKSTIREIDIIKPWLNNAADFFFIRQQETVIAFPAELEQQLTDIRSALYLKKAGIALGTVIRNELIPEHELALSTITGAGVRRIETNMETALQYLRKQEVTIEADIKGWALLTYRQLPLGWIKVLPNRVNNYYPKEWRILNK